MSDLESQIKELKAETKTNRRLTLMLFFALLAAVLMQWRINVFFNERIGSPYRTEASHAQ